MSRPVGIGVLTAALAAGFAYWRRLGQPQPPSEGPSHETTDAFSRWVAVVVVSVATAIYGLSWIAALAKPDFSWDGNTYHVPTIHEWMRQGFIHWVGFDYDPGPGWAGYVDLMINDYPKAGETVGFLLSGALGSSHPVNASNLVFFPLGVTGIVVAARSLGASRASSWTVAAALGLVPILVAQGVTAYVDAALADSIGASVGILAVLATEMRRGRLPWIAAPAAGSAIGLTAACKGSGLAQALLCLGFVVVFGADIVRRAPRASRARSAVQAALFAAAIAGCALSVAGYWYVRDYVVKGNPLAPVRVTLLGHVVFPGVPVTEVMPEEALTPDFMKPWGAWRRIAFTWLQGGMQNGHEWPGSTRYYDARDGGLGYLWAFACVPAVLFVGFLALRASRSRGRGASRVSASVFFPLLVVIGVPFLILPMNWWSRYTMWISVLGLPCLAVAMDHVGSLRRTVLRFAMRGWLVAVLAIACFEGLYSFYYSGLESGFLRVGLVSYTPAGLWRALTNYDHPRYFFGNLTPLGVEAVTAPDAVALGDWTVVDGPLLGVLSMPLGLRDIVFLSPAIANDEGQLRQLLDEHHVRFLFWRDDQPTPAPVVRLATRDERTPGFWRVYEMEPPRPVPTDIRAK
jgi:hypothetical protein